MPRPPFAIIAGLMPPIRILILALFAASAGGCASSGTAKNLSYKTVWQTVGDVLRRRGKLVKVDRKRGLFKLRQARHYPYQQLVETDIRPNKSNPFHQQHTYVEVSLARSGESEVDFSIYAWTEFRAFSRRFDIDHRPELQLAIRQELLLELAHQTLRKEVTRLLAAARSHASVKRIDGMKYVPAGTFTLGSEAGHPDELPVRQVYLKAYHIDQYEVTVGAFKKFIAAGGYRDPSHWSKAGWKWRQTFGYTAPKSWTGQLRESLPVFGVSWYEATAYAHWAGKQLPTEAQWEKGARFTVASHYPWGNTPIEDSNILGQSSYGPVPVQDMPRNVSLVGCHQMGGNVAEWCRDWYDAQAYLTAGADHAGPESGTYRVMRGGSFFDQADSSRASFRDRSRPGDRAVSFGFRCVREAPE